MKVLLVFTVGISLLENAQKKVFQRLLEEKGSETISSHKERLIGLFEKNIKDDKVWEKAEWLLKNEPKKACAETTSFLALLNNDHVDPYQMELEILLMGTEGNSQEIGSFSIAEKLLEGWFENRYKNRIRVRSESFEGGVSTPERFRTALIKLIEKLHNLLQGSTFDEIYVIITGGYKGFIPWVMLITSMYENTFLVYLHEQSEKPLVAPSLFISWDITKLDEMRMVIRRERLSRQEWKLLPPDYQLLYTTKDEYDEYKLNELGKIVKDFFDPDSLWRYGRGRPLLKRLRKKDEKLYQKLMELLPQWEYLWLGDQIPETVEHQQMHSVRLMEYAHWLLTYYPALEEELGPQGLFCLIAALWLHDIGHGALWYKGIPIHLMPSLVRKYHHETSAEMIRKGDYLPEEYREPVALISRFNREHLHLVAQGSDEPSLEREASRVCQEKGEKDRLLLVGALLGLLDGLDVQMDRVVSKAYKQEREMRNCVEIETYLKELEYWTKANNDFNELQAQLRRFYDDYKKGRWKEKEFKQNCENLQDSLEEDFNKAWETKDAKALWIHSLAGQICFKLNQRYHFEKHASVGLVYLEKTSRGKALEIYLQPGEDLEAFSQYKQEVADDICNEARRALKVDILRRELGEVVVYGLEKTDGQERRQPLCSTEEGRGEG